MALSPGALCSTFLQVMANSPRRWPIISSVICSVLNSFPLCTWMVAPTISGRITMSRACVLIGLLMPFCLASLIFSMSFLSSSVRPRSRLLRWREGSSLMKSSIGILRSSSRVLPL